MAETLFYWKSKRQLIPDYNVRAYVHALHCSACHELVIKASPMNGPGYRYFLGYAREEALAHLPNCQARG